MTAPRSRVALAPMCRPEDTGACRPDHGGQRGRADPRPPGKDCDEYPFAATYQGAALEGRGDFHWELIDSSDNSAEGAYRKQWYWENRVIDKDPFWVKIVP